jgi:hypothetical protein
MSRKAFIALNLKAFYPVFYRIVLAICHPHTWTKVINATDLKRTSQLEFYWNFVITMNHKKSFLLFSTVLTE